MITRSFFSNNLHLDKSVFVRNVSFILDREDAAKILRQHLALRGGGTGWTDIGVCFR